MTVCTCSKCGRQHKRLLKPKERTELAKRAALHRWIGKGIKEGQGDGDSNSSGRVGLSGGDLGRDGVK